MSYQGIDDEPQGSPWINQQDKKCTDHSADNGPECRNKVKQSHNDCNQQCIGQPHNQHEPVTHHPDDQGVKKVAAEIPKENPAAPGNNIGKPVISFRIHHCTEEAASRLSQMPGIQKHVYHQHVNDHYVKQIGSDTHGAADNTICMAGGPAYDIIYNILDTGSIQLHQIHAENIDLVDSVIQQPVQHFNKSIQVIVKIVDQLFHRHSQLADDQI